MEFGKDAVEPLEICTNGGRREGRDGVGLVANILKRVMLTRSSTATFLLFQTNSHTAITHATPIPPISTTNTPPTFASPSSFAVELDLDVSSWETQVRFEKFEK